jgi:uncharacterized protein (DUF362 family)
MSRVVVVKTGLPVPGKSVGVDRYLQMLRAGWQALCGKNQIAAAVRSFLPGGVVGMKTNCLVKQFNSTPVALVEALSQILLESGFDANDLVIWERTSRELAEAGFTLNASGRGIRCLGTDATGLGYSESFFTHGRVNSLVSRILTDHVDHNLNLPVLKDHSIAGLSAGLKNMYGAIHNPNKFHDNNCDPYCAHVNSLEPIRRKNRLTILDAVRVQYDGGPGYAPQFVAHYGGLVMGDDPVATDCVALKILERLRSDHDRPPLRKIERDAKYLQTAESIGLGTADFDQIDLRVLLVDDGGNARAGELF